MKIPLSWLKEYIPTELALSQIVDTLTALGLEVEKVEGDVLEIALTPNLAHCASIRGVAGELAAVTEETVYVPQFTLVEKGDSIQEKTSVTVENPLSCPRYACRLITNVRVAPSPQWLKEKIEQCGLRSVNNVVDVTNLVMLEWGHPLHAFDFDKLVEKRIIVRNAKKGEKIVTLDGQEHYPTEETLLICDAKKPIALAGIMGSAETEVTESTTTILLESAYFDPRTIRRASKRMGIHTEASYRFERGCDPNGVLQAIERATACICEIANGVALRGVIDVKKENFTPKALTCRLSRINRLLGLHLAMSEVETIFRRLKFEIVRVQDDLISVKIPTYRHDILHEIDLVEEVARLYGYANFQKRENVFFCTGLLTHSPEYLFVKKARCSLIAEGLQEFLTCDLISPLQAGWISTDNFPSRILIKLLNPHSLDQSVMRPSMLPGMLSVIKYNADHDIYSIAGFEVGRVHFTSKGRYYEPAAASIVLTGERDPDHWESKEKPVDFFDLKGIVENFFGKLKIPNFSFSLSKFTNFHPGRQALITLGNVEVGMMGEVHPITLKAVGLDRPVYFAEINLDDLQSFVQSDIKMQPLPHFPSSTRDWTITIDDHVAVGQLLDWFKQVKSELLESVFLLDIYRSDKLGTNRKNVTFRMIYRDPNKTLSLSAVENEHLRITKNFIEHLQGELS